MGGTVSALLAALHKPAPQRLLLDDGLGPQSETPERALSPLSATPSSLKTVPKAPPWLLCWLLQKISQVESIIVAEMPRHWSLVL